MILHKGSSWDCYGDSYVTASTCPILIAKNETVPAAKYLGRYLVAPKRWHGRVAALSRRFSLRWHHIRYIRPRYLLRSLHQVRQPRTVTGRKFLAGNCICHRKPRSCCSSPRLSVGEGCPGMISRHRGTQSATFRYLPPRSSSRI